LLKPVWEIALSLLKTSPVQWSRLTIVFAWLYHGLFLKLIAIAPLEWQMSSSLGLTEQGTYWFIKIAGALEVCWAVMFFAFYRNNLVIALNIIALLSLVFAVALLQFELLIEAFNPVTTNASLVVLSLIIYQDNLKAQNSAKPH